MKVSTQSKVKRGKKGEIKPETLIIRMKRTLKQ
jgi:hypothetical protein